MIRTVSVYGYGFAPGMIVWCGSTVTSDPRARQPNFRILSSNELAVDLETDDYPADELLHMWLQQSPNGPISASLTFNVGTYAPPPVTNPATGCTRAKPGEWRPVGCTVPTRADLFNDVPVKVYPNPTGDPAGTMGAFQVGQWLVTKDSLEAYWNGSDWAAGRAP